MQWRPKDIPKMEDALALRGVDMSDFLDAAEVDRTTWWRWKTAAVVPRRSNWLRAVEAYGRLTARSRGDVVKRMDPQSPEMSGSSIPDDVAQNVAQ